MIGLFIFFLGFFREESWGFLDVVSFKFIGEFIEFLNYLFVLYLGM